MIGFIVVDYIIKMDFVNVGCENQVHILQKPSTYFAQPTLKSNPTPIHN
jgi:hypothetical protein